MTTGAALRAIRSVLQEKLCQGAVSVGGYMTLATRVAGTTDDTAAFQAALDTGRNVLLPKSLQPFSITRQLDMATASQKVIGEGRFSTEIRIAAAFASSGADGVFCLTTPGQSSEFHDFGIVFEQPDTTIRANLNQYPPAIYAPDVPGVRLFTMRISRAWEGLDLTGNTGQSYINDLLMSALSRGVIVDGALDTMRFYGVHCWPVDLTANQMSIFTHADTIGFDIKRCDDLKITDPLFFVGTPIKFRDDALGAAAFGTITNPGFDGHGGIDMDAAGAITVLGGYISGASVTRKVALGGKGQLKFLGTSLYIRAAGYTAANPVIINNGGELQLVNMMYDVSSGDPCIARLNAGTTIVSGGYIKRDDIAVKQYLFSAAASTRATITGVTASPVPVNGGLFFFSDADEAHVVSLNNLSIDTISGCHINGVIHGNRVAAAAQFDAGKLVGTVKTWRFVGTLDGSGNATFAHGLTDAEKKCVGLLAVQKGNSGETNPVAVAMDGSNVYLTGGVASRKYRVVLSFTTNVDANW